MEKKLLTHEIPVGVVGLGLMGSSIVAALLVAGHPVKAIAPVQSDLLNIHDRIKSQLLLCKDAGLISDEAHTYLNRLDISDDYTQLAPCALVLECVIEDPEIKKAVYLKITRVVGSDTVLASNTSAIPISQLQQFVERPERFLGIHWAEPAFMTRFLEITCGQQTDPDLANRIYRLAHHWGKEPTLLRKDIRGFITNRLMYAVYREIFSMLNKGTATAEDLDKSFRYDAGSWMTLMGVFRRMDYLGLDDFKTAFERIFPRLDNSTDVPPVMEEIVRRDGRGIHNGTGLYPYKEGEALKWDRAFSQFSSEIHELATRYSADAIAEKLK